MDAKTWRIAKEWLAEMAELSGPERAAYLARHCPDPGLRADVLALLANPVSLSAIIGSATLVPGARLGPYEIAEGIGAGGMGEVYRARDPRPHFPTQPSRSPSRMHRLGAIPDGSLWQCADGASTPHSNVDGVPGRS
ncbi:MAG TPA: hypothetical protein VH138_15380 [Vicinamibacterales bacterium]|jgi:hypothetical protein|nr:hypothetical protein [Vicinamibacterales bacterium]